MWPAIQSMVAEMKAPGFSKNTSNNGNNDSIIVIPIVARIIGIHSSQNCHSIIVIMARRSRRIYLA